MRYVSNHFIKIRNDILDFGLSTRAIVLYVHLCRLAGRYCNTAEDSFFRSDKALLHDLRWKSNTLLDKARKELIDNELIEATPQMAENNESEINFYKVL